MKRSVIFFLLLLTMVSAGYSIGLQHGIFRSQSTQGSPWQGTAEIIREHYDITVYPDYLDVELEWEIKAGGVAPAEYRDALEIVGNLNLVQNSVVVSMITWYRDMILKGKLKTGDVAREQYEKVVDRSSDAPPPPRDPVLLELVRQDNYDISIFPVEFGKTRKVRFRYLIPAFEINGVNKISYPHAFTQNATVAIKAAPGVKGYEIETALEIVPFPGILPVVLDCNKFEFMPYRRTTGKESIEFIVPQLDRVSSGSVFYSGSFSTEAMSGEVSHVSVMGADKALLKTSIPQDFVILWRWNHPDILLKYAGQIVRQSKQLHRFLSMLNGKGKRAAMIVSMEGKSNITFDMNAPGTDEFTRMVGWLENVSKHVVIEPDLTQKKQSSIQYDIDNSIKEFNDALQAAIDMFDSNSSALKHLIMLTAGPRLVTAYPSKIPTVTLDSAITLNPLNTFSDNESVASIQDEGEKVENMYWPGVNISGFFNKCQSKVRVTATVGNGKNSIVFTVSSGNATVNSSTGYQPLKEAHLFSNPALKKEINWRIEHNGKVEEFTETPEVVNIDDGLQYARLIGGSKYLYPLADVMPASIASSVGFIDQKYSLVALEEDALSNELVEQYNVKGVPLLESKDIFKATGENNSLPVSDWLAIHPPQTIPYQAGYLTIAVDGNIRIFFDAVTTVNSIPEKSTATNPATGRITVPVINTLNKEELDVEYDFADALSIKSDESLTLQDRIRFISKMGINRIDLSDFSENELQSMSILIFDLRGRIVKVLNLSLLGSGNKIITLGSDLGITKGTYIIKLQGKSIMLTKRLLLK